MCVRCVCNDLKERVNEDYPFNRDTIIYDLHTYFGVNPKAEDIQETVNKADFIISYHKLKEILTMIEQGIDKDDLMQKLEILEVTVDFQQRVAENEEHRIYQHKRMF